MKIEHKSDYRVRRANAYPKITDQLDAVYKLAKALQDQGTPLPAAVTDWVAQVDTVKETFPKDTI